MPKLFIILVRSPLAYSQTLLPPRHMFSKTSCLTILGVNPASCYNKGHRDEFSGFFPLSNWTTLGLFALCTVSPPDIQLQQRELSPRCRNGKVHQDEGMVGSSKSPGCGTGMPSWIYVPV